MFDTPGLHGVASFHQEAPSPTNFVACLMRRVCGAGNQAARRRRWRAAGGRLGGSCRHSFRPQAAARGQRSCGWQKQQRAGGGSLRPARQGSRLPLDCLLVSGMAVGLPACPLLLGWERPPTNHPAVWARCCRIQGDYYSGCGGALIGPRLVVTAGALCMPCPWLLLR